MKAASQDDLLRATLATVAPGTALRDGLERILRGRTGALIVLGHDKVVDSLCTGGFTLDVEFTATGLRELAKMDGAIVCDREANKILRANVHLMPDPTIETMESGTRHRTAERVSKQTGVPVISVSHSMNTVALYVGGRRHVLEESADILGRANQALQTLERYKSRLDQVAGSLSALEIEDLVTIRDVASVVQRLEMVRRLADEINGYVTELGTDGRLLSLQLDELVGGIGPAQEWVIKDYTSEEHTDDDIRVLLRKITEIDSGDLVDLGHVARVIRLTSQPGDSLEASLTPRGLRMLNKVPRLPATIIDRLIDHFGTLQAMLGASIDDLMKVDGVGDQRARAVREGLSRLAESSILERYV